MKYFFWKFCFIIRKECQFKFEVMVFKFVVMDLFEVFCIKFFKEMVEVLVRIIFCLLRNLIDLFICVLFLLNEFFKMRYEVLKSKVVVVMEVLQRKLGSVEYIKVLLEVGDQIRERRQVRLSKRRIEVVVVLERYGREKRKKFEKKKERRKIKGQEQRDVRRVFQGNQGVI